jgi:hypothetical protein
MKRPIVAAIFVAGLMAGTAVPVSGLGGTQITLNCDDGTSLTAVVGADTVTELTQSVQALLNYPAGLSCTLIQTPVVLLGNVANAGLIQGFVNGGGRFQVSCGSSGETFWTNIAVNAHIQDGRVVGTINEAIPDGQCVQPGTFKSVPTCLQIFSEQPNLAWVTSNVTETSGPFYPSAGVTVGSNARFSFLDNGSGSGPYDSLGATPAGADTSCADSSNTPNPFFNLVNGNITVRPQT